MFNNRLKTNVLTTPKGWGGNYRVKLQCNQYTSMNNSLCVFKININRILPYITNTTVLSGWSSSCTFSSEEWLGHWGPPMPLFFSTTLPEGSGTNNKATFVSDRCMTFPLGPHHHRMNQHTPINTRFIYTLMILSRLARMKTRISVHWCTIRSGSI